MNEVKLFASRFAFRVFLHGDELPGNVCHHRINVVASLDSRRGEKAFRQPIQVSLCKHDRSSSLNDVGIEIGPELGQFLAQLFDFFSLILRQFKTRAAIIAQCLLEQLLVFAGEFRMSIGESFDGFVNVLAIIDSHRPFLKRLHGVLSRGAHGRIRVCFLNDRCLVRGDSGLICEIVEGHDGAFESDLA